MFSEYAELVKDIHIDDMVFLDETGIHLALARLYGWSPVGKRVHCPTPFNRGKNVTLIGALGSAGMVAEMMFEGGLDELAFETFVKEVLISALIPGQVVIMDNLTVHKCPRIVELLEEAGNDVIFLPPYSPELDPIEHAWSKIKAKLRKVAARTYEKLVDAVRDAVESITRPDALGWFAHCGYSEPCNTPS